MPIGFLGMLSWMLYLDKGVNMKKCKHGVKLGIGGINFCCRCSYRPEDWREYREKQARDVVGELERGWSHVGEGLSFYRMD